MRMRSNIPDNFNRKFGFRTTREERSRFSSLWVALVYECKTYEQRLDMLKADLEEHSFRNQRYKDLGVETDMQLVAIKFYKRFIKTMEKRRLRSLAVLDEFAKIKPIKNRRKEMNDLEQEFIDKADREENQALIRLTRKLMNSQNLLKAIDDYIHKDNNNINQDTRLALINIKSDLKCDIHGLKELIAKI